MLSWEVQSSAQIFSCFRNLGSSQWKSHMRIKDIYTDLNMNRPPLSWWYINLGIKCPSVLFHVLSIKVLAMSHIIVVTAFPDTINPKYFLQLFMRFSFMQIIYKLFDAPKQLECHIFTKYKMRETESLPCVLHSARESSTQWYLVLNMRQLMKNISHSVAMNFMISMLENWYYWQKLWCIHNFIFPLMDKPSLGIKLFVQKRPSLIE